MSLSSNTLIHFTNTKESLLNILEESFRIFHCREAVVLDGKKQNFYVPMVSFCDIPMSEIKEHIDKYGTYGIGLTKEWAVKHGLNPVLYVGQTSRLSASYHTAMKHFALNSENTEEFYSEEEMALLDIIRYMKNYEGTLERKSITIDKYRFSDEREWRYVPEYKDYQDMLAGAKDFKKNPTHHTEQYADTRLEFEPSDIKYIIINNDSEIGQFVDHLRKTKGKKYNLHEIERLTTRILTVDQIRGDF